MANVERLTKRVKTIEKWIEENEETGGPKGLLDTMSILVQEARSSAMAYQDLNKSFNNLRNLTWEFVGQKELAEEWDKFLRDKENAVQKQETESVPVRDEPEASEGVREENAEEQETTE
jgi:hypothetical protein